MRFQTFTARAAALLALAIITAPAAADPVAGLQHRQTMEPTARRAPLLISEMLPAHISEPGISMDAPVGTSAGSTRQIAQTPYPTDASAEKPWRADIWYGALNPGDFTGIFVDPADTKIESEQIIGFTAGRKLFDLGYDFSFDLGVLGAHRVDEGGFELGMPMTVTFDGLAWRDRLPTKLAISVGPSFISRITPTEKRKDNKNQGSKLLNMFSPELEVGIPDTDWSGFFRMHHRSGIFGLIDGVSGGSTYMTIGVRHRFGLGDELPWK